MAERNTQAGERRPEPWSWWPGKTVAENLAYEPPTDVPVVLWVGDTAASVGTLTVDADNWRSSLAGLLRHIADEMDANTEDGSPDRG